MKKIIDLDQNQNNMKKLLILIFSFLISFNSYGEWVKVIESDGDHTYYIDIDSLKEENGYVYYWAMADGQKPDEWGDMSTRFYFQGECGLFRLKYLSYIYSKQPMGRGDGEVDNTSSEWIHPTPESIVGVLLSQVCAIY